MMRGSIGSSVGAVRSRLIDSLSFCSQSNGMKKETSRCQHNRSRTEVDEKKGAHQLFRPIVTSKSIEQSFVLQDYRTFFLSERDLIMIII